VSEFTGDHSQPSMPNVQHLLMRCLSEDAGKCKRQSILYSFMVWAYQTDSTFTNPDRFQHACVHAKYAFKCAAFKHMEAFKHSSDDQKFVERHFRQTDCAFQELEYMKRVARRCFTYVKPEKIRWLDHQAMQVNTYGSVWVKVGFEDLRGMILNQLDRVESMFSELGIAVITPEEMRTVKDTDNVALGHGLWSLNRHLRTPFVHVSNEQQFLLYDTRIGVALGFASSYSGGGSMRVPEVNEVSYTRLTAGSTRSLRFNTGALGGRCAIAFDYTKADLLMGATAAASVQATMFRVFWFRFRV